MILSINKMLPSLKSIRFLTLNHILLREFFELFLASVAPWRSQVGEVQDNESGRDACAMVRMRAARATLG